MSIGIDLEAIGHRIEELRGKLSQTDFASRLGVDRKTVGTWERGERLPDTRALLGLWAEFDADPAWVLCGAGASPSISADERELLALFRAAPLAVKAAAIGALQGGAGASARYDGSHQVFHGSVGEVAGRDVVKPSRKRGE